ncbi:MAG: 50S ribosomal protein L15 [Planctomycetota bacterium]
MNLKDVYAVKVPKGRRKRRGRGTASGVGGTSGRGSKGQKARSGYSRRRFFEGGQMPLFRRIPKRGFNNANFRKEYAIVNVADLKVFHPNDEVTVEALREHGLVKNVRDGVKLLGDGDVDRPLRVKVHRASAGARAKIEKAGGSVEIVSC